MKKLIITDLDGTILNKGKLSSESIDTVKQLREAGHHFTIATGRHYLAVRSIAEKLEIDIPVICGNGAHIFDLKLGTPLREITIDPAEVKRIHEICNKHGVKYVLYCTSYIKGTEDILKHLMGELRASLTTIVVTPEELTEQVDSVIKVLMIENDEVLRNKVRAELNTLNDISIVSSQTAFVDISKKGSNKGVAVQELAKHLSIPIEDVIAFGDQENDLDMLKAAGTGVVMGNGVELLKQIIKEQTDTVENEGFSKYIKTNLL